MVKVKHLDYIIMALIFAALALTAIDRHVRLNTALEGREQAMMAVQACEADLNYTNSRNG